MRLLIASKNRGKVVEIRALLGIALQKVVEVVTLAELPDVEQPRENGKTFAENARIKALHYAKAHKILCIADDSGLAVEALGGHPGVCSARYRRGRGLGRGRTTRICSMSWLRSAAVEGRVRLRGGGGAPEPGGRGGDGKTWRGRFSPRGGAATVSGTTRSSRPLPREDDGGAVDGGEEPDQPPGPGPAGADLGDEERRPAARVAARCRFTAHSVYTSIPCLRVGTWRSLVAHLLWEQRVAGSNPVVPTIFSQQRRSWIRTQGAADEQEEKRAMDGRDRRRGRRRSAPLPEEVRSLGVPRDEILWGKHRDVLTRAGQIRPSRPTFPVVSFFPSAGRSACRLPTSRSYWISR